MQTHTVDSNKRSHRLKAQHLDRLSAFCGPNKTNTFSRCYSSKIICRNSNQPETLKKLILNISSMHLYIHFRLSSVSQWQLFAHALENKETSKLEAVMTNQTY